MILAKKKNFPKSYTSK